MKICIYILESGYVISEDSGSVEKKHAAETPDGVINLIKTILGIKEKFDISALPVPNILKQDIMINKFEYDHALRKEILGYSEIS